MMKILKSYEIFEFWNFINFEIYKNFYEILKILNFQEKKEKITIFIYFLVFNFIWNFWPFFAIWLADWKWNLVSGWTTLKYRIDNRHKPEYTSHEVYSLWGRVEKMLFRPISKKQNSLSFNKINNRCITD